MGSGSNTDTGFAWYVLLVHKALHYRLPHIYVTLISSTDLALYTCQIKVLYVKSANVEAVSQAASKLGNLDVGTQ